MSGSLANSPAQIISQLLIDLSLGSAPADNDVWPIRFSGEPKSPDNVITVTDTVGKQDGRFQVDGQRQSHPGFQVRIRATNHVIGYAKAQTIAIALDESVQLAGVTVDGNTYRVYSISRVGDVFDLGKNHPTNNLNLFTINAVASLRQTS
jgi:hypothetical protein